MREADLAGALGAVATHSGRDGFTFDDLARAGTAQGFTLSELADWLGRARSSGLLEDLGFDSEVGPRRYRIATGAERPHLRVAG